MKIIKFNPLTEARKVLEGKKTKVSPDVLLRSLAELALRK